jgi:hypothetical protein
MLQPKYISRALLLCALAACTGDMTAPTRDDQALSALSDGANSGPVPGFYFLPPMVPSPSYSGTFDAALQPRVEICQLAGAVCGPTVASYPFGTGSGGVRVDAAAQHYIANWNTPKSLDPSQFYRVQVFVGAFRLGFADVDVVRTGKEKDAVDQTRFVPLVAGQTLPVKFRIETGIAAQVVVSPATASVAVGGTQQFTATVTDLHGNPIPGAPAAWSTSAATVATVNATGLATGVATGQATITATSGAASGSATLTVFNPNTPPVAAPDTFDAIGNVTVPVAAPGLLANDSDGESDGLSVVAGTFPTSGGGTVSVNADGSFTYLSAAGFTGTDSFSYTVTDGQATASTSASVVSAYRVWYVDGAGAGPGDGRDSSPFTTLAGAEAASAGGETIFLRTGAGAYDGGITLKTGQSLTGQGVASAVTAALNGQTVVLLATGTAPTVTRAAGTTVQVAANNVVQGLAVTSAGGAGIAGSGFGSLTVGAISVAAQGGPALDLSAGNMTGTFTSMSSAGSPGSGIRLVGVGGAFSAADGSVTGSAGTAIDVMGGAGSFTYGGDVVVGGPLAVSVTGRTGGALAFGGTIGSTGRGIEVQNNSDGSVAFTGASKSFSTGANPGVLLANNGSAQVSFNGGGLVVATTTGTGFHATGGGTVTLTGAGNSVVSAGGTAVHVENATISAAGLSFVSVSATGGTHGIMLVNTGALNGLQVTGSGAAGSGGTIHSTTGDAVRLENTRNVFLSSVEIRDNAGSGIRGTSVTGFTLDGGSLIRNNGDDAAANEAGVRFEELHGTASISQSTVIGSVQDNVRIVNTAGTLSLSVAGSTFGANATATGRDGLLVDAAGVAVVTVSVQSSQFTGARSNPFRLRLGGSAQGNLSLAGNTFVNAHPAILPGAGGVVVESASGSPTVAYAITGNTFRGAVGSALVVQEGAGSGTFSGTVSGNAVGVAGVPNSGSIQGSGIGLFSTGSGSHTVAVRDNRIRQYNNQGVLLQIGDNSVGGNGALHATVTGNLVTEPGTAPTIKNGIHLNAGLTAGDNPQVCLDMGGAFPLANSITGSGSGGAAGTDFRLRQRFLTTVRLPGYAGANSDNLAVTTFEQARNGGTPTGLVQNAVSTGGGGFVGGAACAQP